MTLKDARTQRGLTQAQLAVRSGVNQQTISRIESRQTSDTSHRIVVCVCRALDLDPEAIDEFRVDLSCVSDGNR